MDAKFWVEIGVQVFLGLAGFAIAVASVLIASRSAQIARAADTRQREAAERAARHEAASGLMQYLEQDNSTAVVAARWHMAREGVDGFESVVHWCLDEHSGAPEAFRSFSTVLIQNRLMTWVSTGELDRTSLFQRSGDMVELREVR